MSKQVIYTVGHSNHPIGYFLELVGAYSINCLIDVRSVAASRFSPQYNKKLFVRSLENSGIQYFHFEEEFGARQSAPTILDEYGKVDFEKVRVSPRFKRGIHQLWQNGEKGYSMVLMCAEAEPLECHRFSMISVALEKYGFEVKHILKDKTLKSNAQLEEDLLKKYRDKFPIPDIFRPALTEEEKVAFAYKLINKEIGYSPKVHH